MSKQQDPHESEHLTREGAALHRAETKAGRGPSRRKLGCLSFVLALVGLLALLSMCNGCHAAPRDPLGSLAAIGARRTAPYVSRVANTGSMRPTFNTGDTILVAPASWSPALIGQPVVMYHGGRQRHILHRAIAGRYDRRGNLVALVLKGDANMRRDAFICGRSDFVGVVSIYTPRASIQIQVVTP